MNLPNDIERNYKKKKDELDELRQTSQNEPVCLLYAAKDTEINHAVVLKSALKKKG